MALVRTKSGIPALDNAFGGFYLKRATLVSGRRKSGKSIIAVQFLAKALQSGENAVIFTAKTPTEITMALDDRGVDSRQAIESGQLILCPYSAMKREGTGPFAPLPFPQASEELAKLVLDHSISCAIFDSVVPWTAIEPLGKMQENAEDFINSLAALKLTSLLLLPNAASPAAQSLTNALRELCPTNIELESKRFGAEFVLRVTKYQGVTNINLPWEKTLMVIPGGGFVSQEDGRAQIEAEMAAIRHATTEKPQKSLAPKFHPLIQQGPADFAGGAAAPAPAWTKPAQPSPDSAPAPNPPAAQPPHKARFKPLVAPSADVFASEDQAAAAPATVNAAAPGRPEAAHGHQDGPKPSFASVIDIQGFAPNARRASPPSATPQTPATPAAHPVAPAPSAQKGGHKKQNPQSDLPRTPFSKIIG